MKTEIDILKDVTLKLDSINIPYMLTGSLAMIYYAQPRMTRDIDLVVELVEPKIEVFVNCFSSYYYVSSEAIKDSIENSFMFNLIHLESSIKVDCIIRKPERYRVEEFNRRRKIKFSDFEIYIVSKEDLILSKLDWAKNSESELQLRDVKNLFENDYDKNYLIEWAKKLNLYDFLMSILNE